MTAQVAADLRAAANVLERDGWTRDYYTDDHGCHCIIGATYKALGVGPFAEDEEMQNRADDVRSLLRRFLGSAPDSWNDAPGRTAAEVISALRAAADRADAS